MTRNTSNSPYGDAILDRRESLIQVTLKHFQETFMAIALIVVDVQNDFCPGGALAVPDGDKVIPVINEMRGEFDHVILSQDWHPADHSSFASQHPGKAPYDTIEVPYGTQILWPDHCIQNTKGAAFHPDLDAEAEFIVHKGIHTGIDSYSTFFENDRKTKTGLEKYLREHGIEELTIVGLATDFCVRWSAVDAAKLGYDVRVELHACRGLDIDGSMEAAMVAMDEAGVALVAA